MPALIITVRRPLPTATATVLRNFHLAWTATHPYLRRAGIFLVSHGLAAADWCGQNLVARPGIFLVHHAARGLRWACREVGELAEDVQRRTK